MQLEIEINFRRSRYDASLASTKLTLDSDKFELDNIQKLAVGMVSSTMKRATAKLNNPEPTTEPTTL